MVLADRFAVLLTINPTQIDINARISNNCLIVNLALYYPAKVIKFIALERTRVIYTYKLMPEATESNK